MTQRLWAALAGAALCAAAATSAAADVSAINFGDDASMWANDGECDDKRFQGPGMTTTRLLDMDIGHDATDCRTAYADGQLSLAPIAASGIDFGDDASTWANDGECDDKRFFGPGMTTTMLLDSDIGHDASDCRAGYAAGALLWVTAPDATDAERALKEGD